MKSSQARGEQSFLRPRLSRMVSEVFRRQAHLSEVKILDIVNTGDQLHLTLRVQHRNHYRKFVRAVTGLIARKTLRSERGPASSRSKKSTEKDHGFWDFRPFSRLVEWDDNHRELFRFLELHKRQASLALEDIFFLGNPESTA